MKVTKLKAIRGKMPVRKTTEKTIMQQIRYALNMYGWYVFRVPPSIYGEKGLCDLIAIKNGLTIFIEVKTFKDKQSDDQKIFESRIKNAGGIYILARSLEDVEWLFQADLSAQADVSVNRAGKIGG